MENIQNRLTQIIPYPYFDDKGVANNGSLIKMPSVCFKCNKNCFKKLNNNSSQILNCNNGFNAFQANINSQKIIVFGLLIKGHLGKIPRKQKKILALSP